MEARLYVREILKEDFNHIANYWLDNDEDFLTGMGVDLNKLPQREDLLNMLQGQLKAPYKEKRSYALIWVVEEEAVGHCNVNGIEFGKEAFMHLHLWRGNLRAKGLGQKLVRMSVPYFFEKLELDRLYCQPYALNPAPNKTLEKVGFQFVKTHRCIPGSLNFEQEVNLWVLEKDKFHEWNERSQAG